MFTLSIVGEAVRGVALEARYAAFARVFEVLGLQT